VVTKTSDRVYSYRKEKKEIRGNEAWYDVRKVFDSWWRRHVRDANMNSQPEPDIKRAGRRF